MVWILGRVLLLDFQACHIQTNVFLLLIVISLFFDLTLSGDCFGFFLAAAFYLPSKIL